MTIKELKATIQTYEDDELRNILAISKWTESKTKELVIKKEMQRRKKTRRDGTYIDKTVDPSVPIRKRLL